MRARLTRVLDRRAVHRGDHVARRNAGFQCRAVGLRLGDDRAFGLFQAKAVGDFRRDRLDLDAQPRAIDEPVLLELSHDGSCSIGRDIKADSDRATGRREDCRVHADYIAIHIEGWSARVALVDGRVDLDVVVVGTGTDVASARGNDAGCDRATKTKRVADRHDPITDARIAVGERHEGEALVGFNLDQGEVGFRIGPDDFRLVDCAIVRRNLYGLGVIDNVIIGHRIAISGDKEAGALASDGALVVRHSLRHSLPHSGTAELLEEFVESARHLRHCIIVAALTHAGCFRFINFDPYRDHGRLYFFNDIGKSGRSLCAVRMRGRGQGNLTQSIKGRRPSRNRGNNKPGCRCKKHQPSRRRTRALQRATEYLIHVFVLHREISEVSE